MFTVCENFRSGVFYKKEKRTTASYSYLCYTYVIHVDISIYQATKKGEKKDSFYNIYIFLFLLKKKNFRSVKQTGANFCIFNIVYK